MAAFKNPVLRALSDDTLFEMFSDPTVSVASMGRSLGIPVATLYQHMVKQTERYEETQKVRARRLHEYSIAQLYEDPERIADANGNYRIDPSSVALLQYRTREASRLAGILDRKFADRAQVDVTHTASPLADFFAKIASQGSTVPIAIEGEYTAIDEDAPHDS